MVIVCTADCVVGSGDGATTSVDCAAIVTGCAVAADEIGRIVATG